MTENQECTQCNACKPLTEFHRCRSGKHGKQARCKVCRNAASRRHPFTCKGCGKKFLGTARNQKWCLPCWGLAPPAAAAKRVKVGKKTCPHCDQEKNMGEFYDVPRTLDRKMSWCKACKRIYNRRRYWATHEPKYKLRKSLP